MRKNVFFCQISVVFVPTNGMEGSTEVAADNGLIFHVIAQRLQEALDGGRVFIKKSLPKAVL